MNCDVGEVTERLLLILQLFCHFTYVTAHSPRLLSLLLRDRFFTYVTWRAAHDKQMNVCPFWSWLMELMGKFRSGVFI